MIGLVKGLALRGRRRAYGPAVMVAGIVGGAIPRSIPAKALAPNAMMGRHVDPEENQSNQRPDGFAVV